MSDSVVQSGSSWVDISSTEIMYPSKTIGVLGEGGVNALAITGMSWNEGVLRLTKTGAFATYTWRSGDTIQITAGTNVTPGTYTVVAKVSNGSITLGSTIGTGGVADIAGTLRGAHDLDATKSLKIMGFRIVAGAAETLTFYKADGTTVLHAIPFTTVPVAGNYYRLGGKYGIQVRPILVNGVSTAGFGAAVSAGVLAVEAYYQVTHEMAVTGVR